MKYSIFIFVMLLMITGGSYSAESLKDPRYRNEDISSTDIIANVNRDAFGNYVYEYKIISSSDNTGHIESFNIDISCEFVPEFPDFEPARYPSTGMEDVSGDNRHVPVIVDAPSGEAALFGIDADNTVGWGVFLDPGKRREGLTIISPAPPGKRQYILLPSMSTGIEYDYSGYDETDDLPWIEDFTVYGKTIGPACPGGEEPARFAGTVMGNESEADNALLSYSEPLRDHLTVPAGRGQMAITIHYGAELDPASFAVAPRRSEYRGLFHPEPGSSETVYLPLSGKKTRIMLRGWPVKRAGESDNAEEPGQDRDVFEIRLTRN